jgi:Na+/proline symporter/signal transduction histidine kinase/CheY-like chemotaxis protein
MIAGWVAVLTALVYLCALFAVAHYADTWGRRFVAGRARPVIYALSLGVYCTSWTFFGSVGIASTNGFDFLPTYLGPIVVIGVCYPFVTRVARLAHAQNITSVADFVAARYGKSGPVAALVATIAVIGVVPYIALQLKAISQSITTVLDSLEAGQALVNGHSAANVSIGVAIVLAGFAMAFGTRHIEATEHQDGLIFAIATESVVKLLAFLTVGCFVTWGMFDGITDMFTRAANNIAARAAFERPPDIGYWAVNMLLAASCILLLPRQFHVAIVENREGKDIRTAAWVFPAYLVAINLFVIPLVVAGHLVFPDGAIDRDMTVLALPLQAKAPIIALITMIGGLSAATAMVIVECVALSVMVSNDLVMPLVLRGGGAPGLIANRPGAAILVVRRLAIILMLTLGYLYLRASSEAALVTIGLLSFAAITQIAPAFVGGLFWSRGTARGAIGGLFAGMVVWAYTLLLPTLATSSFTIASMVEHGPLGIEWLRPNNLFGFGAQPLVQGVLLSLTANILAYVGLSFTRQPTAIEQVQAEVFVGASGHLLGVGSRPWRASITAAELEATVALYLGAEPTRRVFDTFLASRGVMRAPALEADIHLFRFAEHQLASAIGAASSRLALSLLLRRRTLSREAAFKLIDDASAVLQYNRDMLQQALDFARQGITVLDKDMRLICWNREFRDLFDLPPDRLSVGVEFEDIVRYNAERGFYGPGEVHQLLEARFRALVDVGEPSRLRLRHSGEVIEIRSARMPDGGLVTTYTDITETVEVEEALAATNETLEQRVRERTNELLRLNAELARAKAEADEANLSKTRFLAAASHDILQPLNAARLYATSLVERVGANPRIASEAGLTRNLDASLESVEDILTALLEISRLDAGAMKVELSEFPIDEILGQLRIEFEPIAREKGLAIIFSPCTLGVRSDRRLLRRILQNLIANAIKYTPSGRVLVGCRRRGDKLEIQVIDTGLGIPADKQAIVFREFERLPNSAGAAPGIGLGLSIVDRVSKVLGHRIALKSRPGRGSLFSVEAPIAKNAPVSPAVSAATARAPLSGLRVIAIDNDPRILEGMVALLSGWGCAIATADGLAQARELIAQRSFAPDVIIADYHLDDDEDGLSVIAGLRADLDAELPAVLLTADRTPEIRGHAEDLGIRVLHKPLKPAALRALLAQWRVARRVAAE